MSSAQISQHGRPSKQPGTAGGASHAELLLHAAVVAAAFVRITWAALSVSRRYLPGHELHGAFKLYPGWLPGLQNDLSDIQWRTFREGMPKLAAALTASVALSRAAARSSSDGCLLFCNRQHGVRLAAGLLLIAGLHGAHAAHVLLSLALQYVVAWHFAGTAYAGPVAVWAVPGLLWLAARSLDGLPFSRLSPALAWLDDYAGPVRWQIGFNLVLLRMISWGMDLHWLRMQRRGFGASAGAAHATSKPFHHVPGGSNGVTLKQRSAMPHGEHWRGAFVYLGYCLYPPLYLTGPTMTFNDFVCQIRHSTRIRFRSKLQYALRLLACLLLLELLTHSIYANAFARFHLWTRLPAEQSAETFDAVTMAALAFYKLIFLWLKFVVIWRLARLFALFDGIDPPENMLRCVCNNYDISGFWRTWHASFNRWLIRYMYVPMGGQRWRLLNVWPIFTFVALWHDFEWHLLKWAWLMALCIVPEALCKSVLHSQRWQKYHGTAWLRHLCAAVAAGYITIMMAANLLGYGLGQAGVQDTLARVFRSLPTVVGMLASFYSAVQLMFAHRRLAGSGG